LPTNSLTFFLKSKEQSRIKANIVLKYLVAWAKVIKPSTIARNGKIGYIDLFSGPGVYEDGTKSTPLLILEKAIDDSDLSNILVTVFGDSKTSNVHSQKRR
jgi:three-Cys-motif partner protein